MNLKKLKKFIEQEGIQIMKDEKAAKNNHERIQNEIATAQKQMEQRRNNMKLIRNK
ncbi:hypothetical protein ACQRXC_14850 [Niallia taxi]|uniref:hypothetical protein n=1 Tax=Niallia taxi TaxID=2499688 RepID=UPI003F60F919